MGGRSGFPAFSNLKSLNFFFFSFSFHRETYNQYYKANKMFTLFIIPVLKRCSRARGPYGYLRPGIDQSQHAKLVSHI